MQLRNSVLAGACFALVCCAAADTSHVLTPELLIEAARPGTGIVNHEGTQVIVPVSYASTQTGKKSSDLYHVQLNHTARDPKSAAARVAQNTSEESAFLDETSFAFLANKTLFTCSLKAACKPVKLLDVPVRIENLRSVQHDNDTTLVFSATVYEDGSLEGAASAEESEALHNWEKHYKVYDDLMVRHWDQWLYPKRKTQLFSVDVAKDEHGVWHNTSAFRNMMGGTRLESPVGPLGTAQDFAVSSRYCIFTAKDPDMNPAWHTKQNLYLVPLRGGPAPRKITRDGRGWVGSPAISPDGDTIAFLQQYRDGFESDRKIVQTYSIRANAQTEQYSDWQLSPDALTFSRDGRTLYISVPEHEQVRLYRAPFHDGKLGARRALVEQGGVSGFAELADESLLYTLSSFDHPNDQFVYKDGHSERLTDFFGADDRYSQLDLGATAEQFDYIGSDNVTMHGWIVRPPGDTDKKLPLAVLIHGGPEGDWTNAWSTRWNPKVFAAAGFVVAMLDPSGSTSFGQDMTARVLQHWGDRVLKDVLKGVHHVLDTQPNVDRQRVVAAGASFGGYMVNWIQGHNNDSLFKALVTHDGVFNTEANWYTTDELYFPEAEFGGMPWTNKNGFGQFSPHHHTGNWNTPHLIVHGGRDYRLDPAEGIAAFNTLQRRGVPSRLLFFPNEGHWVTDAKNALKWHHEVIGWLVQWSARDAAPAYRTAPRMMHFQSTP